MVSPGVTCLFLLSLSLSSGRREEAGFTLRQERTQLCPCHHDLFQDDLVIFQINRDECWEEVAEMENLKVELSMRSCRFAEIRPPGCLLSSTLHQVRGTWAPPLVPGGWVALLLPAASGREMSCSPCLGAPCLCVFSSIVAGSILERKRHAGEERVVETISQRGICFLGSDRGPGGAARQVLYPESPACSGSAWARGAPRVTPVIAPTATKEGNVVPEPRET